MELIDAVNERRSIRAFKPEPVPRSVLDDVLSTALRAPSWANTQPWEILVVTGSPLQEIRQAFLEKADEQPTPDLPRPQVFPEPYDSRRRAVGKKLFEILGIGREDKEKRQWWVLQGLATFGSPAVIYLCIDRSFYDQAEGLNVWPVFDCGVVAQTIMLLASAYGLGTIAQIQAVNHPDVLRKVLGIPDSKLVVLGIAIGYPDWDNPLNQFRTERESLDSVATWHGFD